MHTQDSNKINDISIKHQNLINKLKCRVCKELKEDSLKYVLCVECNDFFCRDCFIKNMKKDKLTKKNTFTCPSCLTESKKGTLIEINFD